MKSPLSRASWTLPLIVVFLSVLIGFSAKPSSGDWLGLQKFVVIFWGVLFGAILSVVCAILAFRLKEPNRNISIFPAIVASTLLLVFGSSIFSAKVRENKELRSKELFEDYRTKFTENPSSILTLPWNAITDEERRAAGVVVKRGNIEFSEDELEELYNAVPDFRRFILMRYSLRREFVESSFDDALELALVGDYSLMAGIAVNPETPIEILSRIEAHEELNNSTRHKAGRTLKRIQAEQGEARDSDRSA